MPYPVGANVVGANLSRDRQHFAAGQIDCVQESLLGHHREQIHRARQTGNLQREAEELPAMVFVGEPGQRKQASPQCNLVCRMFHCTTSCSDVWNILCAASRFRTGFPNGHTEKI